MIRGAARIPQFFKALRLNLPFIPEVPHSLDELARLLFIVDPSTK
jgi:hypothetical protein